MKLPEAHQKVSDHITDAYNERVKGIPLNATDTQWFCMRINELQDFIISHAFRGEIEGMVPGCQLGPGTIQVRPMSPHTSLYGKPKG